MFANKPNLTILFGISKLKKNPSPPGDPKRYLFHPTLQKRITSLSSKLSWRFIQKNREKKRKLRICPANVSSEQEKKKEEKTKYRCANLSENHHEQEK